MFGRKTSTPVDQVAQNAEAIAKNAHEIEHNTKMIHFLYGGIIILLMIIAGLAFYIGQMLGGGNTNNAGAPTQSEDITITVIDDARCSDCQTEAIVGQLRNLPFLSSAEFVMQDYGDEGVAQYLTKNSIATLPAVVFNTNALFDGGQITPFLTALPDGEYSLAIGAEFDPFAKRSPNGYLTLDDSLLAEAQSIGYKKGNEDASIIWLEFSDLDCPACRALYTQNTDEKLAESFGNDYTKILVHFPLDSIHPNARAKAEYIECAGELGGKDLFYSLVQENFAGTVSTDDLKASAVASGVSESDMTACIEEGRYKNKVQAHMDFGTENFGVNSTPSNIIINTKTGEYEQIRGAAGIESFQTIIQGMLQ